ncbi:hypothetical protein BN128_551 [Cronobacter sakazakii 696]|nr:hypothetical protein BN128_551 [Cronobacter sakazakii 696]
MQMEIIASGSGGFGGIHDTRGIGGGWQFFSGACQRVSAVYY